MASNNPWPHIASSSAGKGQSKGKNNGNKRKDHQQMVLDLVTEMFASTLEQEVIVSLAQNCDWELQSTIDALITLSATVETSKKPQQNDSLEILSNITQNVQEDNQHTSDEMSDEFLKMDEVELRQQLEGFNKFEQLKKNSTKNRMDFFRGNIPKLDISHSESQTQVENKAIPCSPWNSSRNTSINDKTQVWQNSDADFSSNLFTQNYPIASNKVSDLTQSTGYTAYETTNVQSTTSFTENKPDPLDSNETFKTPPKLNISLNKSTNARQLCGLQVHYRSPGTESSSDDEDADVVVEEEFNDYTIPSEISVNVSHFLASTVQTSPPSVQSSKTQVTTTASPPYTPQRNVYEATLERIKSAIHNGDKVLVLIRGLPGSGKSTLAKNIVTMTGCKGDPSLYIFSSDDYFQRNKRGIYIYEPMKLSDAHSSNQRRVYDALKSSTSPVIVHNTNLEAWEMRPYASMAVQRGYKIEVLDVNTPWANDVNELAIRNIHGVPKKKIIRMLSRYEHGITGKKLMELYSLEYSTDKTTMKESINKENVLTAEDMVVLQNINQIPHTIEDGGKNLGKNNSKSSDNTNNILLNYLRELTNDETKKKNEQENIPIDVTDDASCQSKKDISANKDDNHLLQPLGAIGSERKNSLVYSEVNNPFREISPDTGSDSKENILSQCWDFTVLLNGKTFHSNHCDDRYYFRNSEGSSMNADRMRKQDEEFGKEEQCVTICPSLLKMPIQNVTLPPDHNNSDAEMDEFFKQLTKEYNECFDNFEQKKSTVVITEITEDAPVHEITEKIEEISQCSQTQYYENNTPSNVNTNADQFEQTSIKHLISIEETKRKVANKVEIPQNNEETILEPTESIESNENSNDNDEKHIEETDEIISNEESHESSTKSSLGTFLTMLRTSILGNNIIQDVVSDVEDKKINVSDIQVSTIEEDTHQNEIEKSNEIKCQEVSLNYPDQNTDIGAASSIKQENNCDKPEREFISKNNLSIQCERSTILNKKEGDTRPELKICPTMAENMTLHEKLDNVDRITWRESPFPLDDIPIVKMMSELSIVPKSVTTADASTNTTHYDFNVAYVGGTSEPGYRVIDASSRRICEGSPIINIERLQSKLMLDKGSMTDDIFNIEDYPDLNDDDESPDRIPELIELFPHIPREYLTEIYEKCMKNFDWAVELLLDGVPDDVTIKVSKESEKTECNTPRESSQTSDDLLTCSSQSVDNTVHCVDTNSCDFTPIPYDEFLQKYAECNKYKMCDFYDKIDRDVESFNDMDYMEISGAGIFDDISLHLTDSDNVQELTETEKSPEPEETIELNLGCDFVRTLENQFGNPDFQMPDGFQPIISIKKSIVQELYALWIESMYQQLNVRHEQLDQMITKDAEFAKSLEREMEMEETRGSNSVQGESDVPNLNEIMDMEITLASYKNKLKSKSDNDKPDDMASRLSRQMLHESIPDMDPDIFNEILKAHNGNFKETFEIIESNTGRSITPCETRKTSAQNIVAKQINEDNTNDYLSKTNSNASLKIARSDSKCDMSPHKSILMKVANSRQEAQRQFSLRIDNFNKAAEAYRRGYPQVAAYYSQVARLHSKNIETAHADITSALVKDQIIGDNDNTLDLHYLFVTEALQALDEFLDYHLNKLSKSNRKKSSILYIITGRGARSNNGTSKIKPAVTKRLSNQNIRFSEINPGCLKINLYRKTVISD